MDNYQLSVLGFGDNVVDVYEHIHTMYPGGNAVNFAVYAKQLGAARSAYMGVFGSDREAEHVIRSLREEGVELVECRQVIGENGAAHATVDPVSGDRIFLGSNNGGIRGDCLFALDRFTLEYVRQFDLVHSGNYCFTERELPKIRAAGVPISFDFSDDSTDEYLEQIAPLVDYAFVSCSELSWEETYARIRKIAALGSRFVCATRGAEGCVAYDGTEFYTQASKPVASMVDTMGAGDSQLTCFMVRYLDGLKHGRGGSELIRECLDRAADFAAHTCGVPGAWGHGLKYE